MSGLTFLVFIAVFAFGMMMLRHTRGSIGGRLLTTAMYFVSFFVIGATLIGIAAVVLAMSPDAQSTWSMRLVFLIPASVGCGWVLWKLRHWKA